MKKISKPLFSLKALIAVILVSLVAVQTVQAQTRYKVKSSDNLNFIVERFYKNSDLSKAQLMVAVLVENPQAFKGGNINFLLRGKRLTLPNESDIENISSDMASEVLSQHARFFRIGITGDLSAPTLEELSGGASENPNETDTILVKQQSQTKKIEQLQRESDALKKQLEELVNAKSSRDQRLLELEKTIIEAQNIPKSTAMALPENEPAQKLAETNKKLQKKLQETKSELAENETTNNTLERKVENLKEVLENKPSLKRTIKNKDDLSSKLAWLLPLFLLAGFLYYFFTSKKPVDPAEDSIESYEKAYLETREETIDNDFEEDSLEASIKLDVARAYIEAEDTQSALDILTEIMEEGSDEQRQQAHELLETISSS